MCRNVYRKVKYIYDVFRNIWNMKNFGAQLFTSSWKQKFFGDSLNGFISPVIFFPLSCEYSILTVEYISYQNNISVRKILILHIPSFAKFRINILFRLIVFPSKFNRNLASASSLIHQIRMQYNIPGIKRLQKDWK